MAGFLMKQMVGNQLNEVTGGLGLGGGDDNAEKTVEGEDPEVIAARLEEQERRKEKHRKMEAEREKMRQGIRDKYKIHKKEEGAGGAAMDFTDGRIGVPRKTPEELAAAMRGDDDSLIGQLGLTEHVERAKTMATGAFETVKGFLPFGK
ncbi:Chloroperoxidase 1 [Parelaphostrongylus tenuis]|uniref:Putative complexin-1 n=1 Tax=Parelaphostrongylus tenuis TaxID=148309 RepID=A0AAD5QVU1_PARTN|nr:Chloroperoxidase 1 [Parelaphostrongylus tenuis]